MKVILFLFFLFDDPKGERGQIGPILSWNGQGFEYQQEVNQKWIDKLSKEFMALLNTFQTFMVQ
jgi:hypothetical protein